MEENDGPEAANPHHVEPPTDVDELVADVREVVDDDE